MRSRLVAAGFLGLQTIVCGVALAAIATGRVPLGVPGEWVWQSAWFSPSNWDIMIGAAVSLGYAAFAALGYRALEAGPGKARETLAVLGLVVAAPLAQAGWICAAPMSCGFERWGLATLFSGPTGYYAKASKIKDLSQFLIEYPEWIRSQDALHTGTHPPGLFATCYWARRLMERHPDWSLAIARNLPGEIHLGFLAYDSAEMVITPPSDRAAVTLICLFTLLASSLTAVPLYFLARISLGSPTQAWFAACFWPAVPAALVFQPISDAFYPFIATLAYVLAAGAARRESSRRFGWLLAVAAGFVLAVGMGFTLAFLAVGLVVGIIEAFAPRRTWKDRLSLLIATGLGFLGTVLATQWATGFDPWRTWAANQANHSRFYQEYPRGYWSWFVVNPIELLMALGLPAAIWAIAGSRRAGREAAAAAIVLALLNLSGRNLGEVARLWLPLMPPLLIASGAGLHLGGRLRANWRIVCVAILLAGLFVVAMESLVQGVYPAEVFQEMKRGLR